MTASAPSTSDSEQLLVLNDLAKHFPVRNLWGMQVATLKALDGVSLEVRKGEILGIVGESGCGKSTLGKTVMGIHPPTGGRIVFEGNDIANLAPDKSRALRRRLQYSYQDPGASLDPRWKIRRSLHEPLVIHTDLGTREREARIREIMRAVGLPETHLDLYPHEISGGQQRRVGLARILTLHPALIILDEPTSGLDVSIQATVLTLFLELKRQFGLTYVFISHDLAVVRMLCDRVAVMYLGKIVEMGAIEDIFSTPRHPYTQSLLAAIPQIGGRRVTDDFWLEGEPPDPKLLPSGCRFRTRCPRVMPRCAEAEPLLRATADAHATACWLQDEPASR
jgi:oligopeptide/dipeptide ABC transporter ATP-binding protein